MPSNYYSYIYSYQAELTTRWDITAEDEVVLRPEFQIKVQSVRKNPITQEDEPFVKKREKRNRILASVAAVAFFILMVISFMIAIIVYRIIANGIYYRLVQVFHFII